MLVIDGRAENVHHSIRFRDILCATSLNNVPLHTKLICVRLHQSFSELIILNSYEKGIKVKYNII